jgi:altronate hydrolase
MSRNVLKIHPDDNVLVALKDLEQGETIQWNGSSYLLRENIPAKHKFTIRPVSKDEEVKMYGVLVGKANYDLPEGVRISTENVRHASNGFTLGERKTNWQMPDVSRWKEKTFMGYHRTDGSVGTANYWLVIPLVFCENRNTDVLREALLEELGYARPKKYNQFIKQLLETYKKGTPIEGEINTINFEFSEEAMKDQKRPFSNVDGVKFLSHNGGCGGTRQDAQALCGLLAGYITHPNVAGATVLSLGCQNAQAAMLQQEISKRVPKFQKPIYILEQQRIGKENELITVAIRQTLAGLVIANENKRKPAPLNKLCVGLECGGSDGFSGISANPAVGYASDLLVALGGSVILSEFPELCGVEQELTDRCIDDETAKKFIQLMKEYNDKAVASGSGFYMNPSPGNISDGLITDAIKSAGAARKGGTSPVTDVLDYPQKTSKPGLNLLCTPGNDVESTTAEVGSGATIILFTTGLGTPTGNPVTPVIKISSNTELYKKMNDIIDIDTGAVILGEETIEHAGERIFDFMIRTASGEIKVRAVRNGQDDFIPWKRGVSL